MIEFFVKLFNLRVSKKTMGFKLFETQESFMVNTILIKLTKVDQYTTISALGKSSKN